MSLFDEYSDLRKRFQIIAFHDDRAPDLETLDEKLSPIIPKAWKGRQLPFPVLLDASGTTLKSYGIRGFPTDVLINPQGKVIAGGEQELRAILEQQRRDEG